MFDRRDAIHAGHPQIHENDYEVLLIEDFQPPFRTFRLDHRHARYIEHVFDNTSVHPVVFDEKHLHFRPRKISVSKGEMGIILQHLRVKRRSIQGSDLSF